MVVEAIRRKFSSKDLHAVLRNLLLQINWGPPDDAVKSTSVTSSKNKLVRFLHEWEFS